MRPSTWSNRLSPLTNLYRAMENLEVVIRSFSGPFQTSVNYDTCLQLPLNAIWEPNILNSSSPPPFSKKPGVRRCKVPDIYQLDPQTQTLRQKTPMELDCNSNPIVTRHFVKILKLDQVIKLKTFFLQTLNNNEFPTNMLSTVDAFPWINELTLG
jgi:hypothetical protein